MNVNAKTVKLSPGISTNPVTDGVCLEQLVSLLTGEAMIDVGGGQMVLNDQPKCVCPIIAGLGIVVNDNATDADRATLYEFAVRQIGTATDGKTAERALALADFVYRECLPFVLGKVVPAFTSTQWRNELFRIRDDESLGKARQMVRSLRKFGSSPVVGAVGSVLATVEILLLTEARGVHQPEVAALFRVRAREVVSEFDALFDWMIELPNADTATDKLDWPSREPVWDMTRDFLDRITPAGVTVPDIVGLDWSSCDGIPGLDHVRELLGA
jgi:hypothetical protein